VEHDFSSGGSESGEFILNLSHESFNSLDFEHTEFGRAGPLLYPLSVGRRLWVF
jgi:hypothetical protein